MPIPDHPYRPLIEQVCADHVPLPPNILEAMVWTESNFNPAAKSKSNALGLAQIIYKWHAPTVTLVCKLLGKKDTGELALYDPEVNLMVAAKHLRWCYSQCGTWEKAVRKYHLGDCNPPPDAVDGQGTSSDAHITRFRKCLAEVEAEREGTHPVAQVPITIERRIAWNRINDYGILSNLDADITVHENGNRNPGVDAYAEGRFVASGGGSERVLYHFAVDHLRAAQFVPLKYRGRHAGNATGNAISIAIETCQAEPGPLSDATQNNLKWLLVAIATRDPRIDFGDGGHRFSLDRVRGHNGWPGANPRCPEFMTQEWGGVEPVIAGARVLAALIENPEPPMFTKGQTVATTDELNVRIGPGLTYDLAGTLPRGTSGMVIKDGPVYEGGFEWYDVQVSKTWGSGWMAGEYLEESAAIPPPPPVRPKVIVNYDTAMRETPAFDGKMAGVAKAGSGAVLLEGPRVNQGTSWYRVMIAGKEAWIPDSTSTFRPSA